MAWTNPKKDWAAASVPTKDDFNRIEENISVLKGNVDNLATVKEPAFSTLSIAKGGTGGSSVAAARNNLGLGNTAGALPIANGGTGGSSVAAARNNLGLGNTAEALPIANGGTGGSSVAVARNNLGLPEINDDNTYTSDSAFYAPVLPGKSGQILVSNGSGAPVWTDCSVRACGDGATSGTTLGNSNYAEVITVWGMEESQSGHIILKLDNNDGAWLAETHGEGAYWGPSKLCVTALFPKGYVCYVFTERMKDLKYSCVRIGG